MKYARKHRRGGHVFQAGDPFDGDLAAARFLYQRGVLEPSGDPDDFLVTQRPGPRALQRWNITDDHDLIEKEE